MFGLAPSLMGKLMCREAGWYPRAHSKLVAGQAPDSSSSPSPLTWGRSCGLGPVSLFHHHHHHHRWCLQVGRYRWLHGGLETRLLAFSRGDTEAQGHPGPSDVKGQGLFHVAQETDALIWLQPGCWGCPSGQASAFPLVNSVDLNRVGPSRPAPGRAVFPQRSPSQSYLLI